MTMLRPCHHGNQMGDKEVVKLCRPARDSFNTALTALSPNKDTLCWHEFRMTVVAIDQTTVRIQLLHLLITYKTKWNISSHPSVAKL